MKRQTLSIIAMVPVLIYIPVLTLLSIKRFLWAEILPPSNCSDDVILGVFLGLVALFLIGLITLELSLRKKIIIFISASLFVFISYVVAFLILFDFPRQN